MVNAVVRLLFFLCLSAASAGAQVIQTLDTMINPGAPLVFQNNSQTDEANFRTLKADYFPYSGPQFTNFCSAYLPPTEGIDTLTFSNYGLSDINDFYFFLNDRRSMNLDSLVQQIFNNCITEKEKVQALYEYVKENHLYYFAVDKANPIYENYDAAKMLNVYGIGNCGMIANTAAQLAALQSGQNQKHWFISYGTHGISELKFDSTDIYLDADEDGMYLLPDNKTLASFYDVFMDSHLYMRTKHFGNATPYSYDWNLHFNEPIRWGGHYENNTDTLLNINQPCCPKLNGLQGENILISLKPNSSISFIPNDTLPVIHFVHTEPAPSMATVLGNLGKGILKTDFSPINNQPYPSLNSWTDMTLNPADSSYAPLFAQQAGQISMHEKCPYVFNDARLSFDYRLNSISDTLIIYFSKDSIQWTEINWTKQYGPSLQSIDIPLQDYILPNTTQATYSYYIKFRLYGNGAANDVCIRRPRLTSQFQYNKLAGPQLRRGSNLLKLYMSGNQPIHCRIRWTEENMNHAPLNNLQPIFPPDNAVSDSAAFTFKWSEAVDPDGDSIIDYQIQISDRSDMRFPLSTLHDRYLKLTNGGINQFTPEVTDYFNHLTPYYWRVRAQDNKGVWSEWSNTFSFRVKTPMYPRNIRWEKVSDTIRDVIKLKWDTNAEGDSVTYFKVMGSGNVLGFEANDSKNYGQTLNNEILVHFPTGRKRFRVRAIGLNGNQSAASFYINLPVAKTAMIGSSFNYLDTFSANLQCDVQPFPPVGITGRPLFYTFDAGKISASGSTLTAIDTGMTLIDICTMVNQDTIRLLSVWLNINNGNQSPTKPSLIIWAKDTFSVYGNPVVHNGFRYIGFTGNHNSGTLANLPSMSSPANNQSDVGLYPLNPTGAFSPLYNILYQPGIMNIQPRELLLKASDTTITYGSQNFLSFHGIGFVNGDGPADALQMPFYSTVCTNLSLPGTYPVEISGGSFKNYTIAAYQSGMVTVAKAPLHAIPNPCISQYGNQPTHAGISYSGFQNNEDSSILNQQPQIQIEADSTSYAGQYNVNLFGGSSDRYDLIYSNSLLQIQKAPLLVLCKDSHSVYGQVPVHNGFELIGFKGDDDADSVLQLPQIMSTLDSTSSSGLYQIVAQGGADSNYDFIYQSGTHTIYKAPLTIKPVDTTMHYGDFPAGGFSVSISMNGFKNGDTPSDLQQAPGIISTASNVSPTGSYPINCFGGQDNNYYFIYDSAQLSIIPAPLIITIAHSQSTYGEIPALGPVQYQGFKLNETPAVLSAVPQTISVANQYSHAGTYSVYFQDTTITSSNYNITLNSGTHTINKRPLQLFAPNLQKKYLEEVPELYVEAVGLVNNDSIYDLDQAPIPNTPCTSESYAGEYPIHLNDITDNDYLVATQDGTLQVEPNPPSVVLSTVKNNANQIVYSVKLLESGGEIEDIGIEITKKEDGFTLLHKIPYYDLQNVSPPFKIFYTDSMLLEIPNEEFLMRAYATNSAGTSYSQISPAYSYQDDYMKISHYRESSLLEIQTGKTFLKGTLNILASDGRKLLTQKIENPVTRITLSDFPTGVYHLRIQSSNLTRIKNEQLFIR